MARYSTSMKRPTIVLVVNSVGLSLSFFAVVLRFYTRVVRRKRFNLSDYTILASWISTLGFTIAANLSVIRGGVGQNTSKITVTELLFTVNILLVTSAFATFAVTFVKISILDFSLSIFSSSNRFRIAAYSLLAFTVCFGLTFGIVSLAPCPPFPKHWERPSATAVTCMDWARFYAVQAAINAALDCLILLLPLPLVWSLRLKMAKKLQLTALFSLGIVICAISIARLMYSSIRIYRSVRLTEWAAPTVLLGSAETNLTIICACLPVVQPLIASMGEKLRSAFRSSDNTFRGLLSTFFIYGSRKHSHDTVKLGHLTVQDNSPATDESRLRKQHDRLYPISATDVNGSLNDYTVCTSEERTYEMDRLEEMIESNNNNEMRKNSS